jgi:hypothetical protein
MSSRFDEAERLRERARLLRESASKVSLVTDKERLLEMAEGYELEAKRVEESARRPDASKIERH